MKIVQSFWTKPFLHSGNHTDQRLNGGWPERKYNYFSWMLSCLRLKEHYPCVELVTDSLGADILIGRLQLPYTQVSTSLDALGHQPANLWALGKIHAYRRQTSAFLHVDSDIFIRNPFDATIENAGLVAQNHELSTDGYMEGFSFILKHFSYIPPYLKKYGRLRYIPCTNVGIIGGRDIAFMQAYTAEVLDFLDRNAASIARYNMSVSVLNIFFEQVIFHSLAQERQTNISYLFNDCSNTPTGIAYLHEAHRNKGFAHAYSGFKNRWIVYSAVERELKEAYPREYHRAVHLMDTLEL
jgi:hypothetical protein